MNFIWIGCHRPASDTEWHQREDGPSLFPSDKHISFQTLKRPLMHPYRHLQLKLTCGARNVGNPSLSGGSVRERLRQAETSVLPVTRQLRGS